MDKLYYSIGEVSKMFSVNASLLRFWEAEFPSLKPKKGERGTRSYTQKDIELIRKILYLTRDCGFTLEGAREQLRKSHQQEILEQHSQLDERMQLVNSLNEVKSFLVKLKEEL